MSDLARRIVDRLYDEGWLSVAVRRTDCQEDVADVIRPLLNGAAPATGAAPADAGEALERLLDVVEVRHDCTCRWMMDSCMACTCGVQKRYDEAVAALRGAVTGNPDLATG